MNKSQKDKNPNKDPKNLVEVKFKDDTYEIQRGNQKVSSLKKEFSVNVDYKLVQIIDGELKTLSDNDSVVIKGGEMFNSQPPEGDNS